MNFLDWIVILFYFSVIIVLAIVINRSQRNTEDYYLAGRKIKWWQSGASTMATQLGAVSFVSAPAFVALKEGGGLKWLCYEFGVPLALILVMAVIIPVLHKYHYISIYEYLERRFDSSTRTLVSLLFQIGRGLATAVAVLAGALILSTALSIPTVFAIILIGVVTVIYDALGGIKVVILSDFLQMVIIIAGILICSFAAISLIDWNTGLVNIPAERFYILDFQHWGFTSEGTYSFWPMLIGGFFLYASYYGTDQSQVQRELSVGNVDNVRKSLMVNALGRFPLVLSYCFMGIFIGALFLEDGTILRVANVMRLSSGEVTTILSNDPDRMVPMFIISFLPHGVIGFIFVAIMAALMSSLDSGLNSLSAVTMQDFYHKYFKTDASEKHYLLVSKLVTVSWGIFCIAAAIAFYSFNEATRQTTIVLINAVGSMLYGPILAAFLLGMFTRIITAVAIKIGILAGIALNLIFWLFTPISWLWWNLSGFLATVILSFVVAIYGQGKQNNIPLILFSEDLSIESRINWKPIYYLVVLYFFMMILITYLIEFNWS
jgi:sodium-dependent multivitamin transporter 6